MFRSKLVGVGLLLHNYIKRNPLLCISSPPHLNPVGVKLKPQQHFALSGINTPIRPLSSWLDTSMNQLSIRLSWGSRKTTHSFYFLYITSLVTKVDGCSANNDIWHKPTQMHYHKEEPQSYLSWEKRSLKPWGRQRWRPCGIVNT